MSNEKIFQYSSEWKKPVEEFIKTARQEGSAGTYMHNKFDLENLDKKSSLWLAVVNDSVASISYAQRSFITDTPESIRKCRYHILKKYRHGRYGFKMMKKQIEWARQNGFKHYWWTHDVKDIAINELFQHKRKYTAGDNTWFADPDFKKFVLEKNMLFHDNPKSNMLQFIYSYYIDDEYVWMPKKCVLNYKHSGSIKNVKEILN